MRAPLRAFTLVELMVVIALIALLIGLGLPAMNGVRHRARVASCLNNMRNLQQSHMMYMLDHDGRMVEAGLPHGVLTPSPAAWINTLDEYCDSDLVVRSPLDDSKHWPLDAGGDGVPIPGTGVFRRTSYGLNNYLTQFSPNAATTGEDLTLSQVKNPATTVHFLVMVYEDNLGFCGADHVHVENWTFAPPVLAASHMQTNSAGGPEKNVASLSNYGYLDGHVATRQFSDVYVDADVNSFDPARSFRFAGIRRQE